MEEARYSAISRSPTASSRSRTAVVTPSASVRYLEDEVVGALMDIW
jgi:hypothetical protein